MSTNSIMRVTADRDMKNETVNKYRRISKFKTWRYCIKFTPCPCLFALLLYMVLVMQQCASFVIPQRNSASLHTRYFKIDLKQNIGVSHWSMPLHVLKMSTRERNQVDTRTDHDTLNITKIENTLEAIKLIPLILDKDQVMNLSSQQRYYYRVKQLLCFNETYGTMDVPYNYAQDLQLAKWVQSQRYEYRILQKKKIGIKSYLTPFKMQLLDWIGFPWKTFVHGLNEEGLTPKWMLKYHALKEYKRQHGHVRVPENYIFYPSDNLELIEGLQDEWKRNINVNQPIKLGIWVKNQRRSARINPNDTKTKARINKLNELGFIWDTVREGSIYSNVWFKRFEELKQFHDTHGHFHIPTNDTQYKRLALWARAQRVSYNNYNQNVTQPSSSSFDGNRIKLLNEIGFNWNGTFSMLDRRNETWWKRFQELSEFRDEYKHLHVNEVLSSSSLTDEKQKALKRLYRWTKTQRVNHKQNRTSCLNDSRIQALESLNFVWDPRQSYWEEMFEKLQNFQAKYGHYNVPTIIPRPKLRAIYENYRSNTTVCMTDTKNKEKFWHNIIALGVWARGQRRLFRRYKRCEDIGVEHIPHMERLDSIGFFNLSISISDGIISAGRGATRLEKELIWDHYFNLLCDFKQEHGHCFVPCTESSCDDDEDRLRLLEWTALQRRRFRVFKKKQETGKSIPQYELSRMKKLQSLGFIFNLHEYKFERSFNNLKDFFERNGHSKVSPTSDDPHLYAFVRRQRYLYKERMFNVKNSLSDERIQKLNTLELDWCPRGGCSF